MAKFTAEEVRGVLKKLDEGFTEADGTTRDIPYQETIEAMLTNYALALEAMHSLEYYSAQIEKLKIKTKAAGLE